MSQQENKEMEQCFFRASALEFGKIPGSPISYWLSKNILDAFSDGEPLQNYSKGSTGLQTSDSATFLRFTHEPSLSSIGKKWTRFAKGGGYRKWFGNVEHLVNWENDGEEIKSYVSNRYPYLKGNYALVVKNESTYFKSGLLTSRITSGKLSFRIKNSSEIYADACTAIFPEDTEFFMCLLSSKILGIIQSLNPTINFQASDIEKFPVLEKALNTANRAIASQCIKASKIDWDSYETSWDFTTLPLAHLDFKKPTLQQSYQVLRIHWQAQTDEMQQLEEENNRIFIDAYGLQDELTPDVPLKEITLTCNPHYRYGGERTDEELETLLQCDTIKELVSYAIGCMMGRYSLDKSGLILASQGETLDDYYRQIPVASFAPDEDGILPLNDQEWFADDATNRVREFVREVWGEDRLRDNLDFIAESLCLHAIKAKKGEDSLDCIRRYLSTQFFKDHMRMYKNRPIYWLFSSGKHKAFECLVYLHRYNEGTLARMRTEYLIPLSAKLHSYAEKLEQDKEASTSAAEIKSLEKQITDLHNQQAELAEYDEQLRHYADQRIQLDLDDGVKINYGKFGTLLAEAKKIAG